MSYHLDIFYAILYTTRNGYAGTYMYVQCGNNEMSSLLSNVQKPQIKFKNI